MEAIAGKGRPYFQEFMSGSGRLSASGYQTGVPVMFPVDHRYSWDMGLVDHQRLLDSAYMASKVHVDFFSPRCAPWSRANKARPEVKHKSRQEEMPALIYVTQRCNKT